MTSAERLRQFEMNEFCVIEHVIPPSVVDNVRESVVRVQAAIPPLCGRLDVNAILGASVP